MKERIIDRDMVEYEPCEGKLSCTVLRGGIGSDVNPLPELFANTPAGAKSSAVLYSLIETTRENGLDPYRYLCWALKNAPVLSRDYEDWAERLLPWAAPMECKSEL